MPVVIITGCGKGIGRACLSYFAHQQFSIAGITRSESDIRAIKKEFGSVADGWVLMVGDASDEKTIRSFFTLIDQKFSRIHVLINNAGVFQSASFLDTHADLFYHQWKTNTLSTLFASQEAAKRMIPHRAGQIITIISVAAKRAFLNGSAYGSSKSAQEGLARVMREELKIHNIRVTNIFPGAAFTNSWAGSDVTEERLMSAEDVAKTIYSVVNTDSNIVIEELILRPVLGDL